MDIAPIARDLGFVDIAGAVLPPFLWNDKERGERLAALDALFFWRYGIGADDVQYIMSTFPIVREQDLRAFGRYRTEQDIQALLRSLASPRLRALSRWVGAQLPARPLHLLYF